ncbi:MAG: LysR family transcriptional regulator [Burkholderiales bacterium]|nr:LysR family transcriptional regulator [Burkholderiales bacterium]
MLRAIRAFHALHRLGTVAAAAEEVHLSAAAVSAQLKLLEERLGVELFSRTRRSLQLTPAGHRLVPLAEKMLSVHEEMLALSNARGLQGRIAIGVLTSALTGIFPTVLQRLKADTPRLDIRLVTGTSPFMITQVEAGLLDAAVVTRPPKHYATPLEVHPLFTEPVALVLPRGTRHRDLATTMAASPYIALDRQTWVGQAIDEYLLRQGIHVRAAMELNSQDAVLAMVRNRLGVTILPLLRGTAQARDRAVRLVPLRGFFRGVALVERKVHPHTDLTRKLLETIVEVAGEGASAQG